ncbi:MAG: hypothetical protein J6X75_00045 [Clostridia bacterium]|nr:hypothetical protein [Clostridia bacterium]
MKTKKLIKKYSAKLILESLFKSLLGGLVFTFFVDTVFLIVCHIILMEPHWSLLALISVGSLGIGFLFCFFVPFRTSIKKTTRRIDASGLEDRVSTMLEYEKVEDGIAVLQRRDAVEKLGVHSTKKMRFARPVKMAIVLAVMISLSVGMYFMPYFYPEPAEADETQLLLDWQEEMIDELVAKLYDTIDEANVPLDLKVELYEIVDKLRERISREDSTIKKLAEIDKTSKQIADAIRSYFESTRIAEELKAYSELEALGEAIANEDTEGVTEALEELRESFEGLGEEEVSERLDEIGSQLGDVAEYSETEGTITDALSELSEAMLELSESEEYLEDVLAALAEALQRANDEIIRLSLMGKIRSRRMNTSEEASRARML